LFVGFFFSSFWFLVILWEILSERVENEREREKKEEKNAVKVSLVCLCVCEAVTMLIGLNTAIM
jgi:hypothetical protein